MLFHHRSAAIRVMGSGLAAATILVGCGTSAGRSASEATTTLPGTSASVPGTPSTVDTEPTPTPPVFGLDECPTADEVAAIIDTPVDVSLFGGGTFENDLNTSSTGCSYRPTDAGSDVDDQVVISRLSTEDELDGRLYDALDAATSKAAQTDGFTPLPDLGDDAYLDGRTAVVKDGDTMVFVTYEPGTDAELGDEQPAVAFAADVLALHLTVDPAPTCDQLTDIVATRFGEPSDTIPNSGFISIDDVAITSSGCTLELGADAEVTVGTAAADQWDAWVTAQQDSMFTTSYQPLDLAGRAAFDDGGRLVVDDGTDLTRGDSPFELRVEGFGIEPAEGAVVRAALAELVTGG